MPTPADVKTFNVTFQFRTGGSLRSGAFSSGPTRINLPGPAELSQNHSVAYTMWWKLAGTQGPAPLTSMKGGWTIGKTPQSMVAASQMLAAGLTNDNIGVGYVLPLLTVIWHPDVESGSSRSGRGAMNLAYSALVPREPSPEPETLRTAIAGDPDDARLHHVLGISLLLRQDIDGAKAAIERSLALAPEEPHAYRALGHIHLIRNELDAARSAFEHAIALDPAGVEAHAQLAVVLILAGEADDALRILSEQLRLRDDAPLLWANLGAALLVQGRLEEAIDAYRRALALDPSWNGLRSDLALVLFTRGRFTEAVAERRNMAEREPDSAELLNDLGTALYAAGEIEKAIDVYKRAAMLRPEWSVPLENASAAASALNDPQPAAARSPAPSTIFVKQYGERRTGTNLLRTLLAQNYHAEVLMHILGDKHSPPVPFDDYWRDAQRDPNPAKAFVCRSTFSAPSLTTTAFSFDQIRDVTHSAGVIADAFAAGELRYVITIRDPYAWAVSLAWFLEAAPRGQTVPAECAEAIRGACREFNTRYAAWLELAEHLPSRAAFIRYEELRANPEAVCENLARACGLTRRTSIWQNQERMVLPANWDNDRELQLGPKLDRDGDGSHHLSRECRDAVEATIDWPLVERIYALAGAVHPRR